MFFNIRIEKKREAMLISVLTAIVVVGFLIAMLMTGANPPLQCIAVSFAISYMLNYIFMGIRRCYYVKRFNHDVLLKSAGLILIVGVLAFNNVTAQGALHEMDIVFTIFQVLILLCSVQSIVNILR